MKKIQIFSANFIFEAVRGHRKKAHQKSLTQISFLFTAKIERKRAFGNPLQITVSSLGGALRAYPGLQCTRLTSDRSVLTQLGVNCGHQAGL